MRKFKKKIMGLLILIYVVTAALVLFLLNFSYIQNNKNSISRILNMKFQIVSSQSESNHGKVPEMPEENEAPEAEDIKGTDKKEEDSYIEKSYLVAKSEDGTLYIKNMLPDGQISEEELIEITENILATQKNSGSYQNYQFERTSFTNGNLKGGINAGRYTADYLQCGNLPYLAWKNAHNCAGLSYRRIRRYLV